MMSQTRFWDTKLNDHVFVRQIPTLQDNYVYFIHHTNGETICVDPGVDKPVLSALKEWGWKLNYIINTHHHWDHTDGNLGIKKETNAVVIAAEKGKDRYPGIDIGVDENETKCFEFKSGLKAKILNIPGHTKDHIAYWFEECSAVFCGDTLFSLGCGRLFEGTAAQMLNSLNKLASLPKNTLVFCAHEYTEANGKFAMTVESEHQPTKQYLCNIVAPKRAKGLPSVPSLLSDELGVNPFLRVHDNAPLRKFLKLSDTADDVEAFAALRKFKDGFKASI